MDDESWAPQCAWVPQRPPVGRSSLGERQRVALERAFASDRAVRSLDEPTAHLDGAGRAEGHRGDPRCRDRGAQPPSWLLRPTRPLLRDAATSLVERSEPACAHEPHSAPSAAIRGARYRNLPLGLHAICPRRNARPRLRGGPCRRRRVAHRARGGAARLPAPRARGCRGPVLGHRPRGVPLPRATRLPRTWRCAGLSPFANAPTRATRLRERAHRARVALRRHRGACWRDLDAVGDAVVRVLSCSGRQRPPVSTIAAVIVFWQLPVAGIALALALILAGVVPAVLTARSARASADAGVASAAEVAARTLAVVEASAGTPRVG